MSLVVDLGDALIGRGKFRPLRHIIHTAIGVMRTYEHLLLHAALQKRNGWQHFQTFQLGVIVTWGRRPRGNPLRQHAIGWRVDFEAYAPLVRNGTRGFRHNEAATGIGQLDTSPARLARDRLVVCQRIVSAQGKLEAPLAGQRTVTCARTATGLGQNRFHVMAKAPIHVGVKTDYLHLGSGRAVSHRGRDLGPSIARRKHFPRDDSDHAGVAGGKLDRRRRGPLELVTLHALHQQSVLRERSVQLDLGWQDGQRLRGVCWGFTPSQDGEDP